MERKPVNWVQLRQPRELGAGQSRVGQVARERRRRQLEAGRRQEVPHKAKSMRQRVDQKPEAALVEEPEMPSEVVKAQVRERDQGKQRTHQTLTVKMKHKPVIRMDRTQS